jgi:hypothetical protein
LFIQLARVRALRRTASIDAALALLRMPIAIRSVCGRGAAC